MAGAPTPWPGLPGHQITVGTGHLCAAGGRWYFDYQLHQTVPAVSPGGHIPMAATHPGAILNGWTARVSRPDFIFEYAAMEDELGT
jgi:hypothetical protein